MKAYDFQVILEPDEEAGGYVISCLALSGCHSQGDTIDEALENIKEAIVAARCGGPRRRRTGGAGQKRLSARALPGG